VSNPFNYEFMEHASTTALPAYTPVDGHDLHVALTAIDHELQALYPKRIGARALMAIPWADLKLCSWRPMPGKANP